MPRSQTPEAAREAAITRGRELVERYANRSPELGTTTKEQTSAAGDLIADVLAYTATLPDSVVPAVYRGDHIGRVSRVAARGVWDAVAELLSESTPGEDPAPDDLEVACEAFCAHMRAA